MRETEFASEVAGSSSRRGFAIIMVLFILAMLLMIAFNFIRTSRWNSASTRNLKEETIAYYLAVSGYHKALGYLMSDTDIAVDFIDGEGNFWLDSDNQPVTGKRTTEEGEVNIRITDENSKININLASGKRLKKLF
jgi:type II secretory pathway component PulK